MQDIHIVKAMAFINSVGGIALKGIGYGHIKKIDIRRNLACFYIKQLYAVIYYSDSPNSSGQDDITRYSNLVRRIEICNQKFPIVTKFMEKVYQAKSL